MGIPARRGYRVAKFTPPADNRRVRTRSASRCRPDVMAVPGTGGGRDDRRPPNGSLPHGPHPRGNGMAGRLRAAAMIYLLRHGETVFNAAGRYQGGCDSPLTERGRRQAAACAAILAAEAPGAEIRVSPLGRAMATAEILRSALPEAPWRIDPRLREVSMGRWDGLTRAEIEAGWPGLRKRHPGGQWMFVAPGGEDAAAFRARLAAALEEAGRAGRDVILVGHGVAGRILRGLHAGLDLAAALRLESPQGEVYRLDPGGAVTTITSGI